MWYVLLIIAVLVLTLVLMRMLMLVLMLMLTADGGNDVRGFGNRAYSCDEESCAGAATDSEDPEGKSRAVPGQSLHCSVRGKHSPGR